MDSPSRRWAPQSSDDERREAMERYRRDYYAPRPEQPKEPRALEVLAVVGVCVAVAAATWAILTL